MDTRKLPVAARASRDLGFAAPERTIVLLGAVGVLVGLAFTVAMSVGYADVWFGIFLVALVLAVPVFLGFARKRIDPFEPIYMVAAAYFLYFVWAPGRDVLIGDEFFFNRHIMSLLPEALIHAFFGLAALMAGYYARIGERVATALPEPTRRSRGAIPFAWAIGVAAVIAFGASIRLSGLSWMRFLTLGQYGVAPADVMTQGSAESAFVGYLFSAADWFTPAFLIAFAFSERRRKWLIPAFIVILLIYTTIAFRYKILIFVLAPLIYAYLRSARRPRLFSIAVSAVLGALFIGAVSTQRLAIRSGERIDPDVLSAVEAHEAFNRDLDIYQPFAAVVHAFPRDADFMMGASFAYVLVHPIPRGLWEDKPAPPVHTIIRAAFEGSGRPVTAGVAYPNIGEFYANFGLLGVLVGMFLFGMAMRVLYEFTLRHVDNEWACIIFAIALPFLVQVVSRGYFVAIVQYVAFLFGPVILGMWLLPMTRDRARGRSASAAARELPAPLPMR